MKKVQVKDLRAGDVLASGAVITSNPVALVRTPKGKLTLGVKYPKDSQAYARDWGKYTEVQVLEADTQAPAAEGWSYKHSFGVIAVQGWGDPFLIVTEDKFWNGQHWGYNYTRLGETFQDAEVAKMAAAGRNKAYNLPRFFSPEESQAFLLDLQARHPEAEIAKKEVKAAGRTKAQTEALLVGILAERGVSLRPAELRDFDVTGEETDQQIREYASDYLSELQTERSEAAAFRRSPGSVDPVNY